MISNKYYEYHENPPVCVHTSDVNDADPRLSFSEKKRVRDELKL